MKAETVRRLPDDAMWRSDVTPRSAWLACAKCGQYEVTRHAYTYSENGDMTLPTLTRSGNKTQIKPSKVVRHYYSCSECGEIRQWGQWDCDEG